jgi:hypothetical protein
MSQLGVLTQDHIQHQQVGVYPVVVLHRVFQVFEGVCLPEAVFVHH